MVKDGQIDSKGSEEEQGEMYWDILLAYPAKFNERLD
jgi:hypothetical protein